MTELEKILVQALSSHCDKLFVRQARGILNDLEKAGYRIVPIQQSAQGETNERVAAS